MMQAVRKINGVAMYSPLLCVHMCTQTIVMLCIIYYVYQLCSNRDEANNDVIVVGSTPRNKDALSRFPIVLGGSRWQEDHSWCNTHKLYNKATAGGSHLSNETTE